uniref:Uncharacterized protein n=1 Tax=Panagrolaimus superbus TaxID=310955 RepID=A0A914YAH9_9BILA
MPTLILIYSNQNETLTFTTQISFSETCRSSILYSPPSNCQKLQSAYLVHSFKFNKYKYSLLKDIYEGPESDENVEEMDYDFLSNGTKRIEYKDKTEKSSSSLQGVFEGEHFNLADILGEDDESACDSGDESGSDSDTLSENEQQKDDFEQIFTYKLKIFVE